MTDMPNGYTEPGYCWGGHHRTPRQAVVLVTMLDTTSLDSQDLMCGPCAKRWFNGFIELVKLGEPDLNFELQPVWQGSPATS